MGDDSSIATSLPSVAPQALYMQLVSDYVHSVNHIQVYAKALWVLNGNIDSVLNINHTKKVSWEIV